MIADQIKYYARVKNICFWQIVANSFVVITLGIFDNFAIFSFIAGIGFTVYYFYCDYRLKKIGIVPVPTEFNIITKETVRINNKLYQYRIEYSLNDATISNLEKYLRDSMYKNKSLADINFELSEFFIVNREGLYCIQDDSFTLFDELGEEQKNMLIELKKNNPINPIQKLIHIGNFSH